MRIIILILLAVSFPVLSDTTTFDCKYTHYSDPDGFKKVDDKFDLSFLIDNKSGKSYSLGNIGSNEVISIGSKEQLSFVEVTASKNVMITTIDGELSSVHSRNTVMFGTLIPSQYYGSCTKK